jgi:hypothetical protein
MLCQRGCNNAGADGVDASAAFTPLDAFRLHPNMVSLLGDDVRDHGIRNSFPTQDGERQQLIGRRKRQGMIVFLGKRSGHVTGIAGDDELGSTGSDDAPELFDTTALPYRSTASTRSGGVMLGETPAVFTTCTMLPSLNAASTRERTDSREETSTFCVDTL